MRTIEIDFDVWKALTGLLPDESATYSDVLRHILKLDAAPSAKAALPTTGGLTCKGLHLPAGTELRANYKGSVQYGVVEDGAIVVNNKKAATPSQAATLVTGNNVNGWMFWECRLPGGDGWKLLKSMR